MALHLYLLDDFAAGSAAPVDGMEACDRLPEAPRQRLIVLSGPQIHRKQAGGVIAACRRLVAWLGLTNLLCLQKAILGATVVAVVLAGSAIVKKVPHRPLTAPL